MATTPCYPTDLTDDQWALLAPLLPPRVAAGAPRTTAFRALLNALFYVVSNGLKWRALPAGYPPEGTGRDYCHRWRRSGLLDRLHATLRAAVRVAEGHAPDPSAGSMDSQSVKAAGTSGTRGFDAGGGKSTG